MKNKTIEMLSVNTLSELTPEQQRGAVSVYQNAFARPPYEEVFSDDEAQGALQYLLDQQGDLLVAQSNEQIVALAGGYLKQDGVYYIEELAVEPAYQGRGLGRQALRALIAQASEFQPLAYEIRTTVRNDKAISLYTSEGFVSEPVTQVVAQARQDGRVGLDERVYLKKEISEESMEEMTTLKRVAIVFPSGNTTAVVFDQLLTADREALNSQVMAAWELKDQQGQEVEQCCFVTLPKDPSAVARVEMFGGEFCGNATRSVIQLVTEGRDYQGTIEVSGVDRPLAFSVDAGVVGVEMPLPRDKELMTQVDEGMLVQLDGIAQLVVTDREKMERQTPREMLTELLEGNRYSLAEQPAVGVSYYDNETNTAQFGVWVKEVQTIFDETACGSGTCAIGVAQAKNLKQNQSLSVIQPSGEMITTEAIYDENLDDIVVSRISGSVSVLYDGELSLS